jgi:hypothetical protein
VPALAASNPRITTPAAPLGAPQCACGGRRAWCSRGRWRWVRPSTGGPTSRSLYLDAEPARADLVASCRAAAAGVEVHEVVPACLDGVTDTVTPRARGGRRRAARRSTISSTSPVVAPGPSWSCRRRARSRQRGHDRARGRGLRRDRGDRRPSHRRPLRAQGGAGVGRGDPGCPSPIDAGRRHGARVPRRLRGARSSGHGRRRAGGLPTTATQPGRSPLVLGGEAHGLPAELAGVTDVPSPSPWTAPSSRSTSAMAGAVVLFEAAPAASGARDGPVAGVHGSTDWTLGARRRQGDRSMIDELDRLTPYGAERSARPPTSTSSAGRAELLGKKGSELTALKSKLGSLDARRAPRQPAPASTRCARPRGRRRRSSCRPRGPCPPSPPRIRAARPHRDRRRAPARSPPPGDPDPRRARRHLHRHGVHRGRGSRDRDRVVQLRRPQLPARPPSPGDVRHPLRRVRRTRVDPAAHPYLAGADEGHGAERATHLRDLSRSGVPQRHPRREPHAGVPPDRGSRGRRGDLHRPIWPAPWTSSPPPTSVAPSTRACGPRTSPSPSPRPSSTSPV